eukprot:CAMPEP_0194760942 /NCGR_PEP_ID=MMETSP0323_2-20130528/13753_1 /TAXON_ID=2866 ORGANISM="Crypthecodinium cohnii, Strain Seligo" /NCGR_SAMPLE_ID=MMETSP0323_2 /ASSEMBLY_ACC=CAM_ASM_000346 /LENGTH=94 /DNA_ID=CAMNT_0039682455 /DNA_START=319 /DNA_END=604 /DNA_ORIENTATION=+
MTLWSRGRSKPASRVWLLLQAAALLQVVHGLLNVVEVQVGHMEKGLPETGEQAMPTREDAEGNDDDEEEEEEEEEEEQEKKQEKELETEQEKEG